MSTNQQKQSSTNHWLSNILRPRASSITVESCLNLPHRDTSQPLDARPILPLLEQSQPLQSRCKHLTAFADICKSYRFTHLENVFFTVQDILKPTMPREARHTVFKFMLACITGQYADLGMARVTFYASLRTYTLWEDFEDMYNVLYALCKGGRDISGFEKNISKLLIYWMEVALQQRQPQQPQAATAAADKPIPLLGEVLHLLTVIAKFNFAIFEEDEVTQIIRATHKAFFISQHPNDIQACLEFADIVVRYRFVPFEALTPFLEMIAASIIVLPDLQQKTTSGNLVSSWPIFHNLLRSHCAHSAILSLCRILDQQPSSKDSRNLTIKGAITLLSETAWGRNDKTGTETYTVSDSLILMYFKRAASKDNDGINGTILKCLRTLIKSDNLNLGSMEWEVFWDIVDVITKYILKITDNNSNNDVELFDVIASSATSTSFCIQQFSKFSELLIKLYKEKNYKGPAPRFMKVLYQLRAFCSDETATLLLDHYVTEHSLLPSSDEWLTLLKEITTTFYIHANPVTTTSTLRLAMLNIVTDICTTVKDFYSEVLFENIVIPMMEQLPSETDIHIRQTAIDLLISSMSDCQNDEIFDQLLSILQKCTRCQCVNADETQRQHHHHHHHHYHHNSPVANTKASNTRIAHSPHSPQIHRTTAASNAATATSASATPLLGSSGAQSPLTPQQQNLQQQHQQKGTTDSTFITDNSQYPLSESDICKGIAATCGLTELFENLLTTSNARYCAKAFSVITEIANDRADLFCPYGGPKIVALDLLLRLRCPTNHHLYLVVDSLEEGNSVIAFVRSKQRARRAESEQKQKANTFISIAPVKQYSTNEPMSVSPTTEATQSSTFFPVPNILSYSEHIMNENEAVLDMDDVLKSYIRVLSHSPNWAVVSFVLKRLPQQLSNKHLFCGASTYINKLRRRLVKWTSSRKFLESVINLPVNIKRNDLLVHAYSLLTVMISYRRIFTEPKQDQDEIVYAFYVGIMQVTSATRLCINSLNVCCHEMPLSVTKMLNEILQRMSQIISVGSVSVHILEFLSALARLPNLYANFTGDMYKPVFAIALNYLQHSHSQQQQPSPLSTPSASPMLNQGSNNSSQKEVSQDALKQYVLTMAYLVITVWFTSIPLRERRKHVPFIIQRLLSGISMGKSIDEQTFTCIDMLSRFTFADVSLAPEKSIVSKILMGDGEDLNKQQQQQQQQHSQQQQQGALIKQSQRTWVYGHTLLTLRTAKSNGWIEITIRRPSGTVSMMCYIENKLKSNEIDYRTLPALLMMQYQPDLMAAKILKDRNEEGDKITNGKDVQQEPDHSDEGLESDRQEEQADASNRGYALGITFGDGTTTRQEPKEQNVERIGTITPGSIASPEGTASPQLAMSRQSSASQRNMKDNISKESDIDVINSPNPSLHADADSQKEILTTKKVDSTIHEILSEPKTSTDTNPSLNTSVSHLRKTEHTSDPAFLYLQINNYPDLARSMEVSPPLPDDEATARTLATFDRIPVVDFHKIGVLYVGKGQKNEVDILANTYGSPDYVRFLNSLGTIQRLKGFKGNTGGLDREMDIDGRYAYFWKDDVTEAVFHIATLMPTHLDRDPQCSAKKRHIGNDYVSIVYNDSGADYAFDTLPSQFNFINIVVSPHSISTEAVSPSHALIGAEYTFFKVEMQRRPDMPDIGPLSEPTLVSAQSLPGFVRQMAIHANIFAQVFWQSVGAGGKREYVSHWRERLRQIQRVKERLAGRTNTAAATAAAVTSTTATNLSDGKNSSSGAASKDNNNNGFSFESLLDFTKYT